MSAARHIGVIEVWRREKNSGRHGSGRKFITSVKVERPKGSGEVRVVVDAYSTLDVNKALGTTRGVGAGSRATWFSAEEWMEVSEAVSRELGKKELSRWLRNVKSKLHELDAESK